MRFAPLSVFALLSSLEVSPISWTEGCVVAARWKGPFSGPSQAKYAGYFSQVLLSPTLRQPQYLTKTLRQIVFSGLESLNYRALTAAGNPISTSDRIEDVIPFLGGILPDHTSRKHDHPSIHGVLSAQSCKTSPKGVEHSGFATASLQLITTLQSLRYSTKIFR